jgi:hypothetical protein
VDVKLVACAVVLAVAALAAGSAGAKEGVEAILLTPVPKDAAPGSSIRVEWRLAELNGRPFSAGGIFVRLLGPGGAATTTFAQEGAAGSTAGRFTATAAVPEGGLRGIRIGLRGWNDRGTADVFFRIVNDPFTGAWAPLRRPLHVPMIPYGAACPVSARAANVDFARYGVARGYGLGPAYPIGFADGTIHVGWGRSDVDARVWGVQKVLWFVHPRYHGPVLVRGEQVDGQHVVRFERGRIPRTELRIPAGVRARPSYVRIERPGCYAFQIDGLSFSRTIVFRAVA